MHTEGHTKVKMCLQDFGGGELGSEVGGKELTACCAGQAPGIQTDGRLPGHAS